MPNLTSESKALRASNVQREIKIGRGVSEGPHFGWHCGLRSSTVSQIQECQRAAVSSKRWSDVWSHPSCLLCQFLLIKQAVVNECHWDLDLTAPKRRLGWAFSQLLENRRCLDSTDVLDSGLNIEFPLGIRPEKAWEIWSNFETKAALSRAEPETTHW